MTNTPSYPLIVIDNSGYLDLIDNEDPLTSSNALVLIRNFHKKLQAYYGHGNIWKVENVESKYKINNLTKFLAYTFYNPSIKVTLTWKKERSYQINELKNAINKLVDQDDDILTQFEEGDIIKKAVDNSNSFQGIIDTLNKYVFNVDEQELWKEQETRK